MKVIFPYTHQLSVQKVDKQLRKLCLFKNKNGKLNSVYLPPEIQFDAFFLISVLICLFGLKYLFQFFLNICKYF